MSLTTRNDASPRRPTTRTVLVLGYGAGCYAAFVGIFLYAVAFLADAPVPRTVDHGHPSTGTASALVVDALLLAGFAVSHSVMARAAFKRRWTTVVPHHLERSTYVLVASAALALTFWQWRPIDAVVWDVSAPVGQVLLWTIFGLGWAWVLAMSCAIDHLGLFGLRQVARHLRGLAARPPSFALPRPHRLVRHPMMVGFFPAFLATPRMTAGHLVFAALGCGYVLVGVRLEERDLARELPEYVAYAAETPRFVPIPRRRG